ncbi:RsmE family RNA methyltransferase [Streptococcus fryi]
MQQYFVKGVLPENPVTISDKDTIKHMFQVMRLSEGDKVVLVFDNGVKYLSQVRDDKSYQFELLEALPDDVELPVEVVIASAFPKGDKLEWIAQKATELGASGLWAFPSQWSVVKWDSKKLAKKLEKLAKIAQGAAEQSHRNKVPDVRLFETQQAFLAKLAGFDKVFLAYEESAKAGERLLFIFGPEGGISPEELALFEQAGAIKVALGPRILRAETAPLYALSAVSYALELSKHN